MSEILIPKTHHFNERRPSMIIIHGTEVDAQTSRDILSGNTEREASAHYLIEEDGKIIQYLDESARAFHAGVSYWAGFTDLNSASIGIELVCLSKDGSFSGNESVYTRPQMDALVTLCKEILSRHKIAPWNILAHQDISPARRWDPGVHFDWRFLAANGIGLWHDLTPATKDVAITDNARIDNFKDKLISFGYRSAAFDAKEFSEVIRAFQTHFLPWNICGRVTEQSVDALNTLLEKKNDHA